MADIPRSNRLVNGAHVLGCLGWRKPDLTTPLKRGLRADVERAQARASSTQQNGGER